MTQVFSAVPELNILNLLQKGRERVWATLVFRLALNLRPLMLDLHLGLLKAFLLQFDQQRKEHGIEGCLELCQVTPAPAL